MIIAVDFDGTIVSDDAEYDDITTPLQFLPGAREGLLALKKARHTLLLWSARSNLALRHNWRLNPLWVRGPFDAERWKKNRPLQEARYKQMCDFIAKELPSVFAYIDDGTQGKPLCDLFLDDKAVREVGVFGFDWRPVVAAWGV